MSMNNKQRWMGGVVLLGGGVLLAALLLKGKEEIHQTQVQTQPKVEQPAKDIYWKKTKIPKRNKK